LKISKQKRPTMINGCLEEVAMRCVKNLLISYSPMPART